ncbi:MAG TPA: tetratricopeptide repeat protein, partial [Candidatus Methylacidiphilales bacterium]|nr:tetratricopeptide repeat protein [Candidatus Methylacidiphilales bacterium]
PFIGFHEISFMRFSWVMDHFLYIPIIGLIGLAVAALEHTDMLLPTITRPYRMGLVAAVVILLAMASRSYAKIYVNQIALWTYTIRLHPEAWPAHNNLGNALSDAGRLPEAMEQYEEALSLNPSYPEAHNDLGIALFDMGRVPEAIEQFKEALKFCPTLVAVQTNLQKVEAYEKAQLEKGSRSK